MLVPPDFLKETESPPEFSEFPKASLAFRVRVAVDPEATLTDVDPEFNVTVELLKLTAAGLIANAVESALSEGLVVEARSL